MILDFGGMKIKEFFYRDQNQKMQILQGPKIFVFDSLNF